MAVEKLIEKCDKAMMDDMNTPILIGHLFEGVKWISALSEGRQTLNAADLEKLKSLFHNYVYKVLGLNKTQSSETGDQITGNLVEMILQLRTDAKAQRDFDTADRIREKLSDLGITIKDRLDGADWEIN